MSCTRHRYLASTALAAGLLGLIVSPASAQPNPERNAYFGETHLIRAGRSTLTYSATIYRSGRGLQICEGQTIKHPLGYDIKIDTPLDWMA